MAIDKIKIAGQMHDVGPGAELKVGPTWRDDHDFVEWATRAEIYASAQGWGDLWDAWRAGRNRERAAVAAWLQAITSASYPRVLAYAIECGEHRKDVG